MRTYFKRSIERCYQGRRHKYFTLLLKKVYFYEKEHDQTPKLQFKSYEAE